MGNDDLIFFILKAHDDQGNYHDSLRSFDFGDPKKFEVFNFSAGFLYTTKSQYLGVACTQGRLRILKAVPTTVDPYGRALCERTLLDVPEDMASLDDLVDLLSADSLKNRVQEVSRKGETTFAKPLKTNLNLMKAPRIKYNKKFWIVSDSMVNIQKNFLELSMHLKNGSFVTLVTTPKQPENADSDLLRDLITPSDFLSELDQVLHRRPSVISAQEASHPRPSDNNSKLTSPTDQNGETPSTAPQASMHSNNTDKHDIDPKEAQEHKSDRLAIEVSDELSQEGTIDLLQLGTSEEADGICEPSLVESIGTGTNKITGEESVAIDAPESELNPIEIDNSCSLKPAESSHAGNFIYPEGQPMNSAVQVAAVGTDVGAIEPTEMHKLSSRRSHSTQFIRYREMMIKRMGESNRRTFFKKTDLPRVDISIYNLNESLYREINGKRPQDIAWQQFFELLTLFHEARLGEIPEAEFVRIVRKTLDYDRTEYWGDLIDSVVFFKSLIKEVEQEGNIIDFLGDFAALISEVIVRTTLSVTTEDR